LELTPSSPVSVGYFLSVVGTGSGSGLSKNSKKTGPDRTSKHYQQKQWERMLVENKQKEGP
jgi:hypothetical protein